MRTKNTIQPSNPIEYIDTMSNIYGEEAIICRDNNGYYFRLDYNRKRVNAASYNQAVNTLMRMGYHF